MKMQTPERIAAAFFEPNVCHMGKEALITLGCGQSPLWKLHKMKNLILPLV
ncbi:MAG: hypothetical protein PHP98_08445 [Kiritimatiellae bacterium]|jgi:hypothetical protein|nr:hypothetical protein [Kiritimatiellia bacterium]